MKVLITHNDFDGCVCAVLFKTAFPDGIYYFENYDTVDERINEVLSEAENPKLFITDIAPQKQDTIDRLDEVYFDSGLKDIILLDHHKTVVHLNTHEWASVDCSSCGARLFYEYLRLKNLKKYEQLVFHANDYDLWQHKDPHSSVLNSLLYIYDQERFINRFLENPSVELTETEKLMLEIEAEKQEQYIREAAKTAIFYPQLNGPVIAVVCAERYTSQLGDYLLNLDMSPNHNADIVAIVNAQKSTVSLRSKNWDVSAIARACGGGGHERAAGFKLEDRWLQDDVAQTVHMYASWGEKYGPQFAE